MFSFLIRKWVHKRCSGVKVRLKQEDEFIYQTSASQDTDRAGECPCTGLNGQPHEVMEMFLTLVTQ